MSITGRNLIMSLSGCQIELTVGAKDCKGLLGAVKHPYVYIVCMY